MGMASGMTSIMPPQLRTTRAPPNAGNHVGYASIAVIK
jgi:hypothetical protein